MLPAAELRLLSMPADGYTAMEALRRLRPDLLIADSQLPLLEGANLLQRAMKLGALPVRPAGVLLYDAQFPIIGREALEDAGVLFLEKPLTSEKLRAAIEQLRCAPARYPRRSLDCIERLLDELGVPPHRGRECLKSCALRMAADDKCRSNLTRRLYPLVAQQHGLNAAQVERAIRHVIDLAWQSDRFENQYRIFEDTVDAGRGQPTCGEMISRLADIIRLEG